MAYNTTRTLRLKRFTAPEPPFFCATAVLPFTTPREDGIAIDYLEARAVAAARVEVTVCDAVSDQLSREKWLYDPIVVEASGAAENVHRSGAEAVSYLEESKLRSLFLTSSHGAVPESMQASVAIAAWPLSFSLLEPLFTAAAKKKEWGLVIPVIPPVTTDHDALRELVKLASKHGASFAAPLVVELDPTARREIASMMPDGDDEDFASLFDFRFDLTLTAAARHMAAVVADAGLRDEVPVPSRDGKSNWDAAVILARTAAKLFALERDVELAWTLQRAARVIAELNKPLVRIAESASLGIIDPLDRTARGILEEWLDSGSSRFYEKLCRDWRLRRDVYR